MGSVPSTIVVFVIPHSVVKRHDHVPLVGKAQAREGIVEECISFAGGKGGETEKVKDWRGTRGQLSL